MLGVVQQVILLAIGIVSNCQAENVHHRPSERLFSGWLGGGESENKVKEGRYLPATLQVLEHTAAQVNGTWGDESAATRGARPYYEELEPLPGLVRLTVLRNSLLAEAKAAKLEQVQGFSSEVENELKASSKFPLPEQLASIIERTVQQGELNQMERSRGSQISELAISVVAELRDSNTELSRALRQFPALRYSAV